MSLSVFRDLIKSNLRGLMCLALLVSVLGVLGIGCGSEPDLIAARGRSIEIHTGRPVVLDKITWTTTNGEHRVIRPRASNRQLATVMVTVVNRTSTVMPILIDPEAARLGDRRGERIFALDPFERSVETQPNPQDEEVDKYLPLLWGDIQLDRHFQVEGWIVFDVPKGLTLGTLWWDEVDDVLLDFIDYRRRR